MNSTLVIGRSGEGKTTFVKEKFIYPDKPCLAFDINNEFYEDRRPQALQIKDKKLREIINPRLPVIKYEVKNDRPVFDRKMTRARYIGGDMEEFLNIAVTKRNCNIIIDESTMFFDGKITAKKLTEIIVLRKHRFTNIVLNFHAIGDVPPALYRKAEFIVLFKTDDTINDIPNKGKFLEKYFLKLKEMPDHSKFIIPRT